MAAEVDDNTGLELEHMQMTSASAYAAIIALVIDSELDRLTIDLDGATMSVVG